MRLNIDELTLCFGDRVVYDGASVSVSGPMAVAIMGPSGSGKTTLLSVIAGHSRPTSGSVTFSDPSAPRLDWIMQQSPLLMRRSALDNAAIGPLSRGVPLSEAKEKAMRALQDVGLVELANRAVRRLSGGEKQRVAVARSMAMGADILLADEPTASLDMTSKALVVDALLATRRQGALVLVATHDTFVAEACDRVLIVEKGALRDR